MMAVKRLLDTAWAGRSFVVSMGGTGGGRFRFVSFFATKEFLLEAAPPDVDREIKPSDVADNATVEAVGDDGFVFAVGSM